MNNLVKEKALFELSVAKKYLDKMLILFENKHDCIRVVKNSRKAQKALGNARKIVLEGHLECCLREKFKRLNSDQEFNKIVQLLRN
ncbi:hypothetical protein A2801_03840 [Candidatus Woesebacteria bacterium RIFCSPHIGHO2_01_FULL_41_10]|uniref:Uncharacterized protein n=1 Tax=Candidatus Woesebacteria bacterium RIFCSPHIGHO2_01_FULL_41_10 TaxID=1802500 RepID=A0A1F7YS15_9BACT|nr:MAG: hypothetical protein A2801_03840 [Candidatus Woesebacteria bacterium RIFCSPHIGHO2_01_FULL_41_10]